MTKPSRTLTGATIVATLALLPPLAAAQPNQPTAQGNFTRPESPGRPAVPNSGQDYTQAMERLFQAAQRLRESIQAMAQQPSGERRDRAMAQAREALLGTQQAMVQLPPELRTDQNYRDAEARAGEARRALGGDGQADPQRAQAAVDAILVLIPRLRDDAAKATPAAATGVPLARGTSLVGANLIGPGATMRWRGLKTCWWTRKATSAPRSSNGAVSSGSASAKRWCRSNASSSAPARTDAHGSP
jgi:hypothetical protein